MRSRSGSRNACRTTSLQHSRSRKAKQKRVAFAAAPLGTELPSQVHGCPEKFRSGSDRAVGECDLEAIDRDGLAATAAEFLEAHPELRRGDLFGRVGGAHRLGPPADVL